MPRRPGPVWGKGEMKRPSLEDLTKALPYSKLGLESSLGGARGQLKVESICYWFVRAAGFKSS